MKNEDFNKKNFFSRVFSEVTGNFISCYFEDCEFYNCGEALFIDCEFENCECGDDLKKLSSQSIFKIKNTGISIISVDNCWSVIEFGENDVITDNNGENEFSPSTCGLYYTRSWNGVQRNER